MGISPVSGIPFVAGQVLATFIALPLACVFGANVPASPSSVSTGTATPVRSLRPGLTPPRFAIHALVVTTLFHRPG